MTQNMTTHDITDGPPPTQTTLDEREEETKKSKLQTKPNGKAEQK